ncbi:hypothetical protein H4R20_001494 [Coemansia guatemalensis]|uniref:PCI domain-containing protein n=1 Tax=Coemansia guatemalensis TaxID=2761395 RepID=A0A9W8LUV2_9FUNG|nr:hypothetical protein H4R20_001494 [Coemansia guatemalensis]
MSSIGDSLLGSKLLPSEVVLVPKPTLEDFSLEGYLKDYKGFAKISRARHVGQYCSDLAAEGYRIARDELKQSTFDTAAYVELCRILTQYTGGTTDQDSDWILNTNMKAKSEDTEINAEFDRARKRNSKQESMRALTRHVELLQKVGRMDEAIKKLQDNRDSCPDVRAQGELHIEMARISQLLYRWMQITTFLQRVESVLPDPPQALKAEMAVMRAQASFGSCEWESAVNRILQLRVDVLRDTGVFERGVVTARDIALYGTLAGLAAHGRDKVKSMLIDSMAFRQFLDQIPECQRLLQSYYDSNYGDALARLDSILSFCKIDPVIGPHVSQLYQRILENLVVLYVKPFASLSIEKMARVLSSDAATMERLLVKMIEKGRISARIDGATGFLVKHTEDPRDTALKRTEEIHSAFLLQTELMKYRIQYLEEESVVGSSRGAQYRK